MARCDFRPGAVVWALTWQIFKFSTSIFPEKFLKIFHLLIFL